MTRFIGEAVGQRSGRSKGTSAKDLRKEMEDFQKSGRHAELDQAAAAERVPALPERDMNRPHIFLDLRQNNKLLGRLVIEIFEDLIPTTARHLMNRCREGMEDTFKNTSVHKLIPDLAAFGGLSRGYKQHSSTKLKQNGKLHHSQKGALSISLTGAEFAITFAKALTLDSSHQESPGDALQAGLGQKRKAEEPTKPASTGKRRYLDALDDASDSNSDSDDAG